MADNNAGSAVGTAQLSDSTGSAVNRMYGSLSHLCPPGPDNYNKYLYYNTTVRRAGALRLLQQRGHYYY